MRLPKHLPEYLMEAAGLGMFMISACVLGAILEHPLSYVKQAIPDPFARRALMGLAMGATAVAIIFSPWGKRSGAHINPAVTLAYWQLGKINTADAFGYVGGQFAGAVAGVGIAAMIVGPALGDTSVNYVATVPGRAGAGAAFVAEAAISFGLLLTVLFVSNSARLSKSTPWFAGALIALYILFESPLSGMSMNPARTLGSAVFAREWAGLWIYFSAPPLGMSAAALFYRYRHGVERVLCAKLHHHNGARCVFNCNFGEIYNQ